MRSLNGVLLVSGLLAAGCNSSPNRELDNAPVGSDVQVTKQDGALVEGRLTAKDAGTVRVEKGATKRTVPRSEIVDVRVKDEKAVAEEPVLPPRATFREVTIPESTKISVKLNTPVSSETSKVEDAVEAELIEPVIIDGQEVLPTGSLVKGVVTSAEPTGKVKGRASLAVRFRSIESDGVKYPIDAQFSRLAKSEKGDDVKRVGIPAIGGAVIGGIIGGGKGAAIGAAAGGGAGTAAVLMTAGDPVTLAEGATLSLTIGLPVDVRGITPRASRPEPRALCTSYFPPSVSLLRVRRAPLP
jgi:hypothetical protein